MRTILTTVLLASVFLLIPLLFHAQATDNNIINTKKKEIIMQSNKELIIKLYEQSMNKRNMKLLPELFSDEFTGPQGLKGAAAFESTITPLMNAFPDIQWKIGNMVAEDNKVAVYWKWEGTQTGQFRNIAATGKKITNNGMAIFECKEGKIINIQIETDRLGFLQELDVLPLDLARVSIKKEHKDALNFIDKFFVPAAAKEEFYQRMNINRSFIRKLPGFIDDAAYEYSDQEGNLICVTVAQWENKEVLNKAKEAVQAAYKKEGFDPAAMFSRLNITVDRGVYTKLQDQ